MTGSDGTFHSVHHDRPGAADLAPANDLAATPIADGIWMSSGLSNAYLISGASRRIVINTGMGFEGPVHRALFDTVDARPTALVIVTQGHFDHVGGINHFLEADGTTQVAAGAEWATWKADNERLGAFRAQRAAFAFLPKVLAGIERVAARFPDADTSQGEIIPTIEVADPIELEVDGVEIHLIPVPGGETRDSLVVWLPQRRICFTGNTFGPLFGHVPNLVTLRGDRYRDALDYVAAVETVRGLDAETLVTGHWNPIVGAERIDRELANLRDAMQHVHDRTVDGMNAGTDVDTLMTTVTVPEHLDVGENYGLTRWNVRAIWENYAGWFHARSSAELYPSPRASGARELVALAGGPDPVAERAAAKLAEEDAVLAIHLAETALAVDPDHKRALAVAVEAHRALAARSANFWEQAWLGRQIEALTSRLIHPATEHSAHDSENTP